MYVKAGLEKEKVALLVVLGGLSDGRKMILAVEPGYREPIESWLWVLRDLKRQAMGSSRLVVGDGNLGLWGALGQVFPEAAEPRSVWGTTRWSTYQTSYPRKPKPKTLDLSEGCRLSPRKRLMDSEFDTPAPVLSAEGSRFIGAVDRGKGREV